jgi:hypothetical protein
MTKYSLCLVLILSFCNAVAVAPIYGWKDEKEQWHFSDLVPAGISAKKMLDGISTPESLPATPQTEPNPSPTAASNSQEKAVSKEGLNQSWRHTWSLLWRISHTQYFGDGASRVSRAQAEADWVKK